MAYPIKAPLPTIYNAANYLSCKYEVKLYDYRCPYNHPTHIYPNSKYDNQFFSEKSKPNICDWLKMMIFGVRNCC